MPRSSEEQPKYLMCVRALALLTGLAGSVTACEGTAGASVYDGGPIGVTVQPDAADADSPAGVYDGGFHGVMVMPNSGCDCDLSGASRVSERFPRGRAGGRRADRAPAAPV